MRQLRNDILYVKNTNPNKKFDKFCERFDKFSQKFVIQEH